MEKKYIHNFCMQLDIPSVAGVIEEMTETKSKRYVVGNNVTYPLQGKELLPLMKDCMSINALLFYKFMLYMMPQLMIGIYLRKLLNICCEI